MSVRSSTWKDYVYHTVTYVLMIGFALLCFYPFYYLFIATLSSPEMVSRGLVTVIPREFTFYNYLAIFQVKGMMNAFLISTARTVLGTLLTLFASALFAYTLTKSRLPFRKTMYRATIASMYISAGLIPWFLVMKAYGLQNSFWLYVLPTAISPFYVLLIKVFMEQIPPSLEESGVMDGAGYWTLFAKIVMPLSLPVLAAVAVFSAVSQWNSWFDNMIMVHHPNLQTLQYVLWTYLSQAEQLSVAVQRDLTSMSRLGEMEVTPTSIRMTITMFVTMPIMLVYPFMQRYFVKGIMLGAIKG
jgi:ABC-type glycerol-3-phosphate transport system permease component